jgi:hypothetical protein
VSVAVPDVDIPRTGVGEKVMLFVARYSVVGVQHGGVGGEQGEFEARVANKPPGDCSMRSDGVANERRRSLERASQSAFDGRDDVGVAVAAERVDSTTMALRGRRDADGSDRGDPVVGCPAGEYEFSSDRLGSTSREQFQHEAALVARRKRASYPLGCFFTSVAIVVRNPATAPRLVHSPAGSPLAC